MPLPYRRPLPLAPFPAILALLAASVVWGGRALAQGSRCAAAQTLPEDGATIPPNAPALKFAAARSSSGFDASPDLQLVDDMGAHVPFTLTEDVLIPVALRANATYRWSYVDPCSADPSMPRALRVERTFYTGDVAPLPVTAGELTVGRLRRGIIQIVVGGDGVLSLDVAAVPVTLRPPPELVPFLPLLETRAITVDGMVEPPEDTAGHVFPLAAAPGDGPTFLVAVRCGKQQQGLEPAPPLAPGVHTVALTVGLVGQPDLRVHGGRVRLGCVQTATPFADVYSPESEVDSGGGCAVSGDAMPRGSVTWAALSLIVAAAARRRRARR